MKRSFLLFVAVALSAGVNAQSTVGKSVGIDRNEQINPKLNQRAIITNMPVSYPKPLNATTRFSSGARTTASGGRWYSYAELADVTVGFIGGKNFTWPPLWWDSTVQYRYSSGLGASEWAAVAQTIDPIRYKGFNDVTFVSSVWGTGVSDADIAVESTDAYVVDTIRLRAAYIRRADRPATVRDTLIVCVAPQQTDWTYDTSLNNDWIFTNTSILRDNSKIYCPTPRNADSIARAILVDNTASGAVRTIDTFILDPLVDGHLPDLSSGTGEADTLQFFSFPVNKGVGNTIPAGQHFAVSISFKSGDTWTPNADTVGKFNNFCPVWGFQIGSTSTTSGWMPYMYGVDPTDYNGSAYLDNRGRPSENTTTYPLVNSSGRPARWLSSLAIQAKNAKLSGNGPNGFYDQFLWLDAHISCDNCHTVEHATAVNNVTAVVTKTEVSPNPANDKIVITYNLAQPGAANVYLTNMIGQVVANKTMNSASNGKVAFSTASMPNGIYFYTVEVNGQHTTARFVVAH